jgi:glycosyltransferase involved in cell wall biosynthesis
VLIDPGTVHVCYCHNPFRYAWSEREATLEARNLLTRPALRVLLSRWRQWDWIAAQRVDAYVANSAVTAARIRRYFGREAKVLHPPVELGRFAPGPLGEHYLVLAELMAHKRIDVAIRAFNALRLPLVVVGDGPEYRRLRRLAGPTVRLTGRLSDGEVADLLRGAQALIVTAEEEFGIAAVESLASGRPVIGLRSGGVLETVQEGVTGTFYDDFDDPRSLAAAVAGFDPVAVDPAACVTSARKYDIEHFQDRLRAIVDEAVARGGAAPISDRPAGGLLPRRSPRRGAESMRIR